MHLPHKPIRASRTTALWRPLSSPTGLAALCLALGVLLMVKYYPLRPTRFVLGQYVWTPEAGDFRRVVLSGLAQLAWAGDPDRFLPVVDAVSVLEIAGLAVALAWGATRVAGRPLLALALLLALCSGAPSHLIAARGSQDGFVALALIGLAVSLGAGRAVPAALLGALAVAVHEASIVYVASICGLHILLDGADAGEGWRRTLGRVADPDARPALATLAAAVATLAAIVASTHVTPDIVADVCRRHAWVGTVGGTDVIRTTDFDAGAEGWTGVCGLQFKPFSGSPLYVLRSVGVGALFAPVVLVTLALALRSRLPLHLRAGAVAALLLPALLPFVAFDITRFWSAMNLTALYALALLLPHLRGFGRVSPGGLIGAVLSVWAVVAVGIDQWPTGWAQVPRILPNAAVLQIPSFRQAFCAASQSGLCSAPLPGNPR